jgi:hypothetical protein
MGLAGTNWELDFKQCSFHHIMQVLRVCRFSTFALPPAFPPCYCPLAFQPPVRRPTYRMSSESYPGYPECVVSCHGAGGLTNSIRAFIGFPKYQRTYRTWVIDALFPGKPDCGCILGLFAVSLVEYCGPLHLRIANPFARRTSCTHATLQSVSGWC